MASRGGWKVVDGLDAIRLWRAHCGGDALLKPLLAYSANDLAGMGHIKRAQVNNGWI